MKKRFKKTVFLCGVVLGILGLLGAVLAIFFDEAIFLRKGTIYRGGVSEKVVALTFDDGPSLVWTPQILNELKKANVKATFFMVGEHVRQYPSVARRVAQEGHEIENHSYDHHVLLYYKMDEVLREIKDAETAIQRVTGQTTTYFRPPKAWVTAAEKAKIKELGYKIVLWTLNSKDWVRFDDKYIVKYLLHHVQPGDIILFHDSGGAFATEGGNRRETVLAVKRLIEELKKRGYAFVTLKELINKEGAHES